MSAIVHGLRLLVLFVMVGPLFGGLTFGLHLLVKSGGGFEYLDPSAWPVYYLAGLVPMFITALGTAVMSWLGAKAATTMWIGTALGALVVGLPFGGTITDSDDVEFLLVMAATGAMAALPCLVIARRAGWLERTP